MTDADATKLDGITLAVYLYAVKKGKPVGPRDVMKSIKLSSPSVAYRHLQKLEDAGYLAKNEYGEYTVRGKANVRGYVWLGHRLFPKMWIYALVFLGILLVEVVIFAIHYNVETYEFLVFFSIITAITGLAFTVFTVEGALLNNRMSKIAFE